MHLKKNLDKISMGINDKNRLERQKIQAHTEGLIIAYDLLKKRITAERFAAKFAKLKEAELFEFKTGLFTNYFFSLEIKREIAAAKRHKNPLSLIVLDIDNLKTINSKYGHLAGDRVIVAIGKEIHHVIREEDVPCRWGGDEFTILLPQTGIEGATTLANRLQEYLKNQIILTKHSQVTVSASIGIAQLEDGDTADTLFQRADDAAFESKAKGGGKITIHEK
jgi:diguanylate cyclase (GGDEF)-like protein